MQLKNKVVFVTGGARGIGSSCAKALLAKDAKVVIADINEENGLKQSQKFKEEFGEDQVLYIRCDVSRKKNFEEAFQQAVTRYGNVDVLINNAGIAEEIEWERTLDVNIKGAITGTELANAHMRKDKGGKGGVIINIASTLSYNYSFSVPVYVASKHAVIGYTRSLASAPDREAQGVRYACMCPDVTQTTLLEIAENHCRQEYRSSLLELLTQQKPLDVSKVSEAMLSLIEDDDSNDAVLEVSPTEGLVRRKLIVEKA